MEDLDFAAEKTREKHGRKKRFRQLISGMPTGKLKARLISMAAEAGLSIVAVDPAHTSQWGAQHWQKPLVTPRRKMSRHDAAGIAIGRRALGHPIRRRTTPPHDDQSDRRGYRTVQAGPETREREETRPPVTERAHDARRRAGTTRGTRETSASKTVRDARSTGTRAQHSLLLTDWERFAVHLRPEDVHAAMEAGNRPADVESLVQALDTSVTWAMRAGRPGTPRRRTQRPCGLLFRGERGRTRRLRLIDRVQSNLLLRVAARGKVTAIRTTSVHARRELSRPVRRSRVRPGQHLLRAARRPRAAAVPHGPNCP